MIYEALFRSDVRGLDYGIEIDNTTEASGTTSLIAADSPFVVNWPELEDVFAPVITSGATIRLYIDIRGEKYSAFRIVNINSTLNGLITNYLRQNKVTFTSYWTFNGQLQSEVIWRGYLLPNIYTQAFNTNSEKIELNAIDEIAALEYIPYTQFIADRGSTYGAAGVRIARALDIIKEIVKTYTSSTKIDIYNTIQMNGAPALYSMFVNEQLFVDEELSVKEVLEKMLKYVNMTLFAQYDRIMIIDRQTDIFWNYNTHNNRNVTVYEYNNTPGNYSYTTSTTNRLKTIGKSWDKTIYTTDIYKDIIYTAKFNAFPKWTDVKKETSNTGDTGMLILDNSLSTHWAQYSWNNTWDASLINNNDFYATRPQLLQCDNIKLYSYNVSGGHNWALQSYPTASSYYDIVSANRDVLSSYVSLEPVRDKENRDDIDKSTTDYLVLFLNNIWDNAGGHLLAQSAKLAEISYDKTMILANAGYLDLSGSVRFENYSRRIPIDAHKDAKLKANSTFNYSNSADLLFIMVSVKVGNYYYDGVGGWTTTETPFKVYLDAKKGDPVFNDFNIRKRFKNIDMQNAGYLIDLSTLPDIVGDIKIAFYNYNYNVIQQSWNFSSYYYDLFTEFTTMFISNFDLSYIDYPLDNGDVEYYTPGNVIYNNSFEDDNILVTFVNNLNRTNNKQATQHPPCNNIVMIENSGHKIPLSTLYYTTSSSYKIPEDYKVECLDAQYSSRTIKFTLNMRPTASPSSNGFDMQDILHFDGDKDSDGNYNELYMISGADIDYYYDTTEYTIIQKK